MAAISAYLEKSLLDWTLGGAAATQPTTRAVGLSLGAPSSTSGSEWTGTGITRSSIGFGAAASPGGSATNSAAVTFGPVTSAATVSGIQLWDTISGTTANAGNMLFYGALATVRTLASGDYLVLASGALTCSLA